MLDIKFIRDNPQAVISELGRKGISHADASRVVNDLVELEKNHRALIQVAQKHQSRRNEIAQSIPKLEGAERAKVISDGKLVKIEAEIAERAVREAAEKVEKAMLWIPNLLDVRVPIGNDESHNVEHSKWGEIPTWAGMEIKDHVALGEGLGLMDFETAADMSGSRFCILKGDLARLERAIGQYMLDMQVMFGFEEISPPLMVKANALQGTGQLPKFEEDLFRAGEHYLIPTGEVPLTNLVADKIIEADKLPLRYTALTQCFRAEAGSAGRDTRGLIRQHQFQKVELVSITTEDRADSEFKYILMCAENILRELKLPYRVMRLCGGDTGFSATETYDIEVWLPSQDTYREISSVSRFGEFQARRMNARYRPEPNASTRFLHTLNGSGLAVGRTLVAIMENFQLSNGIIAVPEVLVPYMQGRKWIRKAL